MHLLLGLLLLTVLLEWRLLAHHLEGRHCRRRLLRWMAVGAVLCAGTYHMSASLTTQMTRWLTQTLPGMRLGPFAAMSPRLDDWMNDRNGRDLLVRLKEQISDQRPRQVIPRMGPDSCSLLFRVFCSLLAARCSALAASSATAAAVA